MNSKQRILAALEGRVPDRLPVTTHHVMPSFLDNCMGGISAQEFFDYFGLDPIDWVDGRMPDETEGDTFSILSAESEYWEKRLLCSDSWRIRAEILPDKRYKTVRYNVLTPRKQLSMVLQSDEHTAWVSERLIKEKAEIEIFTEYAPVPVCNVPLVNQKVEEFGDRGMVRGSIPSFDIYGQPGCWQDAAVLFGIEELILQTFYDPDWVHDFLRVLQERKLQYVRSMAGARFDLLELGGGFILSPSDHFFDADPELIRAYAEEARECLYSRSV